MLAPISCWAPAALANSILAVRTWPSDEYTRITLEIDQALQATHFLLDNPSRLVVDIQGARLNGQIQSLADKVGSDDPYIRRIRVGQHTPEVLRLVVDLRQKIAPQIFTLKPIAPYQHRLVLDLYPLEARDPLTALLLDMEDDPLGSIIAQVTDPKAATPATPGGAGTPGTRPPASPTQPPRTRSIIIALDPGHGGEDPGAVGRAGTYEKTVVLSIAKRLAALINVTPGMRAYLTRDADYFVPLHVRVQKARRVKADLFISIHADAWTKPSARGGSVYVLSEKGASSTMARTLARHQNASDLIGGVRIKTQDKAVAKVLLDLSTSAQIRNSSVLASSILKRMGTVGRLHKRAVESAGFAVLKAPDMPSILVETAFISNPEEEMLLRSPAHQQKLASAIMAGINDYVSSRQLLAAR